MMIREPGDLPGLVELYSAPNRGRSVVASPNINQPRALKNHLVPRQCRSRGFFIAFFGPISPTSRLTRVLQMPMREPSFGIVKGRHPLPFSETDRRLSTGK